MLHKIVSISAEHFDQDEDFGQEYALKCLLICGCVEMRMIKVKCESIKTSVGCKGLDNCMRMVVCRNAFVDSTNKKSMHACVLGVCICVHTRFVVIDAFEEVCSPTSADFANTVSRPICKRGASCINHTTEGPR